MCLLICTQAKQGIIMIVDYHSCEIGTYSVFQEQILRLMRRKMFRLWMPVRPWQIFLKKNWSSVELYSAYQDKGGKKVTRRELVSKVKEYFGEKVLIFSSPGIASIVLFAAHATTVLSVVKDEEEDIDLSKLAKTIRKEVLWPCPGRVPLGFPTWSTLTLRTLLSSNNIQHFCKGIRYN